MISVRMLPARAGRTISGALAATATVPATAPAATAARRLTNPCTTIAPGLLPRTIQLCIHCQQRPAGFWVRRTGGTVVRRPWCLSCCQELSGTGPDYDCTQTIPTTVPGGPGGPLAGQTLQFVASLISQGAQIVTIRHSDPFILV